MNIDLTLLTRVSMTFISKTSTISPSLLLLKSHPVPPVLSGGTFHFSVIGVEWSIPSFLNERNGPCHCKGDGRFYVKQTNLTFIILEVGLSDYSTSN